MNANRTKRAIVWLTCAALMLSMLSAFATSYPFVGYTTDDLRLRKRPSTSAEVLLVIPAREALIISGADGNFYIVEYEGHSGYAMKSSSPPIGPALHAVPVSGQTASRYVHLTSGDNQLVRARSRR